MIELKNFSAAYGSHLVLDGANSQWDSNQMILLLGENGAGKSTLLKSMVGLADYRGSLSFNGREIRTMNVRDKARAFAYIPQQKSFPQHESTEDFLLMGVACRLSLFGQPAAKDRERVKEVLKLFDLTHLEGCSMDELSGGQVQMLHVARCFVEDHQMLILDEPCAYLDYHKQYAFLKLVKQLLRQNNMGAIISIHDPNLALLFADYVVCLHHSRIHYERKIQTLRDKKAIAGVLNEIYYDAFHLVEDKDEIIMQWKATIRERSAQCSE